MMETVMPTYITKSEQETEQLGMRFAEKLPGGAVVAMYGDLGAGKYGLCPRHGPGSWA